jgi:hypothetical protein
MAFMPVAGGTQLPLERTGTLPGSVFSLSSTAPGGDPEAITRRELSASGIGAVTPGPSGGTWSLVRGAFMADNRLYTGSSDGTFNVRSFDGSTFGSPTAIQLNGLTSFANDLDSVNGMFYDVERGRMYFTQTSVNALYYRKFQLESEVVGASKFASVNGSLPAAGASPALDWRNIRSAFLVDGKLYTALTDGNLYSWQWSSAQGRPVSGTRALVSGPALDRQDWRARDAFNLPQASQ